MDALITGERMTTVRTPRLAHEFFEFQARRTPNAVALEFEGRTVAYEELRRRSDQVARVLRGLGVGPDVLVGLCVERSVEMLVAMLGILKAGGAYVPLDPAFPRDRLAYMLDDSAARVVLTSRATREIVSGSTATHVVLDEILAEQAVDDEFAFELDNDAGSPDDLAFVIYTSGSTGRPKGVMIPHRAVVNFLESMSREPGIRPDDVVAAITTLSFDIAVLELLLPLAVGARIALIGQDVIADGFRLRSELERHKVTVLQATPATWRMLLMAGWDGRPRPRLAITGGEALSRSLADALLERVGELWNQYGPTETTVYSTIAKIEPGSGVIPIGRPIAKTSTLLVSESFQTVPEGEPGELLIGGEGLARGYWNRPELTAEKFVEVAVNGDLSERLYRTGDLARRLPDGTLECLGRIDHQVKIRGFRIELGEIEAALVSHPNLREAVVVARDDAGDGQKRLVAYLIAREAPAPTVTELRRQLEARLPDYMVPSAFVFVDEWPLTPNGKIDRKALPAPAEARPDLEQAFVRPEDEVELRLQTIWQDILGIQPVGVLDNFFELGGDSLMAVGLLAQVEKEFGCAVFITVLAEKGTIRTLADFIKCEAPTSETPLIVTLQSRGRSTPLFAFHPIIGMVYHYADLARCFSPDRPFYGVQARGISDGMKPLNSVEDMAACYIEQMRRIQPTGPYFLAGWSFGAYLAFEIALQLEAVGVKTAYLAVLDEPAPRPVESKRLTAEKIASTLNRVLGLLRSAADPRQFKATWNRAALSLSGLARRGLNRIGRVRGVTIAPIEEIVGEDFLLSPSHRQAIKLCHVAAELYWGRRYHGPIILYRTSRDDTPRHARLDWHWNDLTSSGVEVRQITGEHVTLGRRPYVYDLADQMKSDIAEVESRLRAEAEARV